MGKDRQIRHVIVWDEVDIIHLSGSHDDEYALMLRIKRDGEWKTCVSVDNSHEREGVDVHHMHRYPHGEKGEPEPLPFPVSDSNDARAKVIDWMTDNWGNLCS